MPLQECPCYLNIGVGFYSSWKQQKYFKILHLRGIQHPSYSKGILSPSWRWRKRDLACLAYLWLLVYPKTGEYLKVNFLMIYGILSNLKGKVNSSPVQFQPYLGAEDLNLIYTFLSHVNFKHRKKSTFVLEAVYGTHLPLFPHPANTHLNL